MSCSRTQRSAHQQPRSRTSTLPLSHGAPHGDVHAVNTLILYCQIVIEMADFTDYMLNNHTNDYKKNIKVQMAFVNIMILYYSTDKLRKNIDHLNQNYKRNSFKHKH